MEVQNSNPILKETKSIVDIIPLLQNSLSSEDKELYKEQLQNVDETKKLLTDNIFLNQKFSDINDADKQKLVFLCTLLGSSVKNVLANPKGEIRDEISFLSDLLQTGETVVNQWCDYFVILKNKSSEYIKEQTKKYNALLKLYQQKSIFFCVPTRSTYAKNKYGSFLYFNERLKDDISFLNQYKIFHQIITDKIDDFKDFLSTSTDTDGTKEHIMKDISCLKEKLEFIDKYMANEGYLEIIFQKLEELYDPIINIANQCFLYLKKQPIFSEYNQEKKFFSEPNKETRFLDFMQQFTYNTIQNFIAFSLLDKNCSDKYLIYNIKWHIGNHLDYIDLTDIILLHKTDYKPIKDSLTDIVKTQVEEVKKDIGQYECAEVTYLDSNISDILTRPFFYVEKIAEIKDHAKKYTMLKKWINDNGYRDEYEIKIPDFIKKHSIFSFITRKYPSLKEYCIDVIIPTICVTLSKSNIDSQQDLTQIVELSKKINFDTVDIQKEYIEPFNKLHFTYMYIKYKALFDAASAHNLWRDRDTDKFIAKHPNKKKVLENLRSYIYKEKLLPLYNQIKCTDDKQKKLLENKIRDMECIFYKYEETEGNDFDTFTIDHFTNKYLINHYAEYNAYKNLFDLLRETSSNTALKNIIYTSKGFQNFPSSSEITLCYTKVVPALLNELKKQTTSSVILKQINETVLLFTMLEISSVITGQKSASSNIIFNTLNTYKNIKNTLATQGPFPEDLYAFKIYSTWAREQGLLPSNFDWNNKSLLSLHNVIATAIKNHLKILKKQAIVSDEEDKKKNATIFADINAQKNYLKNAVSLQDLICIYNAYLKIKTTCNANEKNFFIDWNKKENLITADLFNCDNKTVYELRKMFLYVLESYYSALRYKLTAIKIEDRGLIARENGNLQRAFCLQELAGIYNRLFLIVDRYGYKMKDDIKWHIERYNKLPQIVAHNNNYNINTGRACLALFCIFSYFVLKQMGQYIAPPLINGLMNGFLKIHSSIYS